MGQARLKRHETGLSAEEMKAALAKEQERRVAEGQAAIRMVLEKYGLQLLPEVRFVGTQIAANVRLVPKE